MLICQENLWQLALHSTVVADACQKRDAATTVCERRLLPPRLARRTFQDSSPEPCWMPNHRGLVHVHHQHGRSGATPNCIHPLMKNGCLRSERIFLLKT